MKNDRTENIKRMKSGDEELIFKCLYSKSCCVRLDAILWATYNHCKRDDIIKRIIELQSDDSYSLGYSVSSYAIAALDILGVKKYNGNDSFMKDLIKNFLPADSDLLNLK